MPVKGVIGGNADWRGLLGIRIMSCLNHHSLWSPLVQPMPICFPHWITTLSKPSVTDFLPHQDKNQSLTRPTWSSLAGPPLFPAFGLLLFSYHSLFSLLSAPAPALLPVPHTCPCPDSRNPVPSLLSARDPLAAGIHVLGSHFLKSTFKK